MLDNLNIKTKLIVLSLFSVISILFMSFLLYKSIHDVRLLETTKHKVTKLDAQMLMLRRNEKDFMARKAIKYQDKFLKNVQKVEKNLSELHGLFKTFSIDEKDLTSFGTNIQEYKEKFLKVIATQKNIGLNHKSGLYGSLRDSVHVVQKELKEIGYAKALVLTYELRKHEKDFMLRSDLKYVEKFEKVFVKLNSIIRFNKTHFTSEKKQSVFVHLKKYRENFLDFVEAEKIIGLNSKSGLHGELRDAVHKSEKSISSLVKITDETIGNLISNINTLQIIAIIIMIIIIFIISILISKNIISSLRKLQKGIDNLINNKNKTFKIEVSNHDEIGELSKEFNKYILLLEENGKKDAKLIAQTKEVIQRVNSGLFNDTIELKTDTKEVKELVEQINVMIETTNKNLSMVSEVLVAFSNADYEYKIPKVHNVTGIIASIFSGLRITQVTVSEVLGLIDNANKRLSFSAKDLSESSLNLSQESNNQAASLEQTAAAIEQVASAISSSSENAVKMSNYAQSVTKSSKTGLELANKTSTSMDEISEQVTAINEAISVIDQIAFQTNILSLNAAVEAATAGEAGKGFAVVAQEVRNLASRSAEAAKEIKDIVEVATNKASEGKEVSTMMIEGYHGLNKDIGTTIELINEVAKASKEQQEAINQINAAVTSLDQATQRNATSASEIAQMAKSSEDLASLLHDTVTTTKFLQESKRKVCDVDMIFDISSLKSEHLKLKDSVLNHNKEDKNIQVVSAEQCNLGQWILRQSNKDFANTTEWEELQKNYKLVHQLLQKSADLQMRGKTNEELFHVAQEIEEGIEKIFTLLDTIKDINCTNIMKKRK
jgi:methyl-accepting chemotaxis protein